MKITDENFVEEMKKGNEMALEYVIDNYGYILKTIVNKHLFYLEDRKEECINDCLLGIWENIEYFDSERSSFKNWIGGIAKYKSIDYLRKYLKDRELENIDYLSDSELPAQGDNLDVLILKEFNRDIRDFISHLAEEDRDIFIKTYYYQKSAREIAEESEMKESNVYNRLSRGRKKLRTLMGGSVND